MWLARFIPSKRTPVPETPVMGGLDPGGGGEKSEVGFKKQTPRVNEVTKYCQFHSLNKKLFHNLTFVRSYI